MVLGSNWFPLCHRHAHQNGDPSVRSSEANRFEANLSGIPPRFSWRPKSSLFIGLYDLASCDVYSAYVNLFIPIKAYINLCSHVSVYIYIRKENSDAFRNHDSIQKSMRPGRSRLT